MPDTDPTLTPPTASTLDGTTALVTGASRGFGRAIAVALAESGAQVVGVARDGAALDAVGAQVGPSFRSVVADVTDDELATRLLTEVHPGVLVLNAGATPHPASLQDQTWETFSANWHVDVRHVFHFVRAALTSPLAPGSTVIALSSGAARMGSPMSGGYAGAKATIGFINSYARAESDRSGLDLRFVTVLPKLTPATGLGATFVDSYAEYGGLGRDVYLEQLGATLTVDQVGAAVVALATDAGHAGAAFLLSADGLAELS